MTPDTQQARTVVPLGDDPRYPPVSASAGLAARTAIVAGPHGGTGASGAARTGHGGAARPSHASPRSRADAKQAEEDASIVGVVPLLAVLVVTIAGVYIA